MQFDEFIGILNMLKNPEQYEKQALELKAREDAIKANIAVGFEVSKIEYLRKQAEDNLAKAKETLAKAEVKAAKIEADRQAVYDKKFADLSEREQLAESALHDARTARAEKAAAEAEIRARDKELTKRAEILAAAESAVRVLEAEVTQRLEKLKSVMG